MQGLATVVTRAAGLPVLAQRALDINGVRHRGGAMYPLPTQW
jgi:hypothetical protein